MFDQSVIKTTGQWWKALAALWGVLAGGVMLFMGVSRMGDASSGAVFLMLGGMGVILMAAVGAVAAIRCPACGARWIWMGVNGQASNDWMAWLLSRRECPKCGHPNEDAVGTAEQQG